MLDTSLPLSDVAAILRDHLDPETLTKVQADLLKAAKEIAADKAANKGAPKGKTRLVVLTRGTSEIQKALEGGCWICSVPDGEDCPEATTYMGGALVDRLRKAVIAHNEAPKGRGRRSKSKIKIESWFQAFTQLKAKTIKGSGSNVSIKAKGQPAEVIVLTDENVFPTNR